MSEARKGDALRGNLEEGEVLEHGEALPRVGTLYGHVGPAVLPWK